MGVGAIGGLFFLLGWVFAIIAILFYMAGAPGEGYISVEKGRVSGGGTFVVLLLIIGVAFIIIGGGMMLLPEWLEGLGIQSPW